MAKQVPEKVPHIADHQEIQAKTTGRYYLVPVRMPTIKKTGDHKYWSGCGENRAFVHCWWACKLVQPLENNMEGPQKLKQNCHMSQQSQFCIYTQGNEITMLKSYLYPHVHCGTIRNSQDMEVT